MKRLAFILMLAAVSAGAQKGKPAHAALVQTGTHAPTETPIMGCPSGYTLWRLEVDYVHVSHPIDKNGVIPITVEKTETWRQSEEQTLLGDLHKRKHHECILTSHTPTEVSK